MRNLYLTEFLLLMACRLGADEPRAVAVQEPRLGPAPTAPLVLTRPDSAKAADQVTFTNFLRITNREVARQFYNLVHGASENVPMEWSGTTATCTPGTNAAEYLEAVVRRVNYFRAMAGVPAWITFSNEFTRKAQAGALLMAANDNIDHFPPTSWTCYTADGSEAARNSNLALGNAGPDAMNALIRDNGNNNAAGGHRRWMLYPQTQRMGCGNTSEANGHPKISVLWVFDDRFGTARPATREAFVAWPPPGYVPYQVAYARWSFSYPNADFSTATVSMTSNGVALSTSLEPLASGYGENTLIWVPAGLSTLNLSSLARPTADAAYQVTLNNVRISGVPQSFSYTVRVFDPAQSGPDTMVPVISGPSQTVVNVASTFTFSAVTNAASYEYRQSKATNGTFFDGAEVSLTNFTVAAATNLYSVRDTGVKFAGTASFHLAHPEPGPQILTLNRTFLAASNTIVSWRGRLGWAAPDQTARVQLSLDGGLTWSDLSTQSGTDSSGETSFVLRSVALAGYAGQTFRLRLNYDFQQGSYYPQSSAGVGWYVDNFTVTNAATVLSSVVSPAGSGGSFQFTAADAGDYLLEVRPILFGDYPGEFGPAKLVAAVPNTNKLVSIGGLERSGTNTYQIRFQLLNGTPAGYEVWSAVSVPGLFLRETNAVIQTNVPGSLFRATVTSTNRSKFFQIRPL